MANMTNGNCTNIYQTSNQSCLDAFLNLTDKHGTHGGVAGPWHTFSPSLMKSFMIAMNSVFLPIVVIVGLFGNSMTIYIFQKRKRKSSTILLLISLAVADLMCIILQMFYLIVQNRNHHFQNVLPNLVINGFFMTRAIFYLDGISRWIKVVIVMERCIAVLLPLKVRIICTPKRAMIIVMTVFVSVPLSSVPELVHIGVKGDKSSWSTYQMALQAIKNNKPVFEWYGNLFQLLYGMTTLTINLVCNITIIVGIRKYPPSLSQIKDANDLRRAENQRKMTRMLLRMSMFYVVTCLPKDIGAVILLTDTSGVIVFSGNYYFQSVLLFGLSSSFLNNSVNFIIYGTSLSVFRRACCCQKEDGTQPRQIVNIPQLKRNSDHSSSSNISVTTCEIDINRQMGLVNQLPCPPGYM